MAGVPVHPEAVVPDAAGLLWIKIRLEQRALAGIAYSNIDGSAAALEEAVYHAPCNRIAVGRFLRMAKHILEAQ